MVHACRIKGGKASYRNRLVQTHRLKREVKQGFPLYLRVCQIPRALVVGDKACNFCSTVRCRDCSSHESVPMQ